ncbi:hypothetical protein H8E52_10720 [bacterium]|nr:hypothetical protein [bacterium]
MKFLIAGIAICLAVGAWAVPGQLVYEEPCYNFEIFSDYPYYHFGQGLGVPFDQEADNWYWISIQGVFAEEATWYWEMCVAEDYWNSEGHIIAPDFGFPDWTPISDASGSYMELSFVLYGATGAEKWRQDPSPDNGILSTLTPTSYAESADDFWCFDGEPIVEIEWWGWPGPVPDYFMIRFYLDDSTTATEVSTWSELKQLY